ncbi:MAG: hypothetical protein JWR53_109 [Glaciihabitans sp.]|nr:hypothetical protein [Glaciihabitans sp.]
MRVGGGAGSRQHNLSPAIRTIRGGPSSQAQAGDGAQSKRKPEPAPQPSPNPGRPNLRPPNPNPKLSPDPPLSVRLVLVLAVHRALELEGRVLDLHREMLGDTGLQVVQNR